LNLDLIAYTQSFVSFILKSKLLNNYQIKEIILFGSVARKEADKNSDIDLFININNEKEENKIKKIINKELEKFYKSKFYEIWELKNIKNQFKIKIGILDKWKLKRSIISDGIVLYGKYKSYPKKIKPYLLFTIKPIKNITKRNRIIRNLFGRYEKDYKKQGLLSKLKGKKLTSNAVLIPLQHSNQIIKIFNKEKIDYQVFELWSDQLKT